MSDHMNVRRFDLERDVDVSGVSGTGVVAEGVAFSDGTAVIHWIAGEHRSTVVWPDIAGVEAIHGHGGATRIVWTDEPHAAPGAEKDGRRAPVNGMPRGTVAWWEHEKAWEAYHRRHTGQSAERIAERGGFGLEELIYQLGHLPTTWEPGPDALRQMDYFGVQPTRATPPTGGHA